MTLHIHRCNVHLAAKAIAIASARSGDRIADGKIVERWTATDMLTLFQQAGVFAQPEEPASHPRECSFVPET